MDGADHPDVPRSRYRFFWMTGRSVMLGVLELMVGYNREFGDEVKARENNADRQTPLKSDLKSSKSDSVKVS